ncbi:MAG: pro-sigmaK processing inhibitor BofA family protein [Ruminococcus sp.]|nr:pro-sigmaK processing inhibitor BofA family protein [Ruminococcus sp.]
MKWYFLPVTVLASFIVFIIIQKISKNKRPCKRAFISLVSGLSSLIVVDLLSVFTGVYIPISLLSILISIVLGIPGVTSMLCINLIF